MNKQAFYSYLKYNTKILEEQEANKNPSKEEKDIYLLAFFGLIRNGCPFEVENVEVEEEEDETAAKNRQRGVVEKKTKIKRVLSILLSGMYYTCDEADLLEKFGEDYLQATQKKEEEKKPTARISTDSGKFRIPVVNFDMDEAKPARHVEEEEIKETRTRVPIIQNDKNYPDDPRMMKSYSTFFLNKHSIRILYQDGSVNRYTAFIYPLTMDTKDTITADIMVVITDEEGRIRSAYSNPKTTGTRSVNTEFDRCTLVFRGEWKGGEFLTSAGIYSVKPGWKASIADDAIPLRPGSERTSSFYLRHRAENGDVLSVFPTTILSNNPVTGIAEAIVMVEDGYEKRMYCLDTSYITIAFGGTMKKVALYWAGNDLRLEIAEA